MTGFEYRLVSGAGVPLVLAVLGILGKKLARGKGNPSWRRSDFYLGVEFTLAGVAAALINLLEILLKPGRNLAPGDGTLLMLNFGTLFFGMLLFMFVLSFHQDYEDEKHMDIARKKELKMLGGVCNAIGFAVLLMGVASTAS
jgi:hypothetical protein